MKKYFFLLAIGILFFSCHKKNTVFSETFTLPSASWDYDSLIQFKAQVKDTANFYQIWFKVNHHEKYPYANLWIKFIVIGPDSSTTIDTVNLILQDKEHRWFGTGVGQNWSVEQLFADSVRFHRQGVYTFLFQHIMRPDKLNHIQKLGLIIKKQ